MLHPQSLTDRLTASARLWAEANDRSLARLATLVANDGKFFARCEAGTANPTASTLERFARFLGDAANWPNGAVPEEVKAFVHVVGVTPGAEASQ